MRLHNVTCSSARKPAYVLSCQSYANTYGVWLTMCVLLWCVLQHLAPLADPIWWAYQLNEINFDTSGSGFWGHCFSLLSLFFCVFISYLLARNYIYYVINDSIIIYYIILINNNMWNIHVSMLLMFNYEQLKISYELWLPLKWTETCLRLVCKFIRKFPFRFDW